MKLFCPTCAGTYSGSTICPNCGCRLISPSEAFALALDRPPVPPNPARPSILGRIIVGLVVTAGLYLALREWSTAAIIFGGLWSDSWWSTMNGIGLAFGIRAVALFFGGMIAGAGRPSGLGTGTMVGLLATAAFLFSDSALGVPVRPLNAALGLILVGLSAVAGAIGAQFWPGPADVPKSAPKSSRGSSLLQLAEESSAADEAIPTDWVRVMLSATLAVVAVVAADSARQGLELVAGGTLNLGGLGSVAIVDLQIAILFLVIAGVVAGATTGIGLRQGLIAGALATVGLLLVSGSALPLPIEGWLKFLDLPNHVRHRDSLLAVATGAMGLIVFGSVLGNALLPRLGQGQQRSRRLTDI